MPPTTYADSSSLTIEVFPAGASAPVLVSPAGTSAYIPAPGALSIVNPPGGSPVSNLTPLQASNLQSAQQLQPHPAHVHPPITASPSPGNPFFNQAISPGTGAAAEEIVQGLTPLVAGFAIGAFDALTDNAYGTGYENNPMFDYIEYAGAYDLGAQFGTNVADAINAGNQIIQDALGDLVDDLPDSLPNVSLPGIELPDVNFPDISFPPINLPDLNIPEINLPDIQLPNLPQIELPNIQLPGLPQIDLPDWLEDLFPDFPQPTPETPPQPEPPNYPSPQPPPPLSTPTLVDNILDQIPPGCRASLFFIRHRIIENFYGNDGIIGFNQSPNLIIHPWIKAPPPTPPDYVYTDDYGNTAHDWGGHGVGYPMYYSFEVGNIYYSYSWLGESGKYAQFQSALDYNVHGSMSHHDLFKLTPTENYAIDLNDFALIGVQLYCNSTAPNPPQFDFEPPPSPPPPPLPPPPPDDNEEDNMPCCSCAEIAAIVTAVIKSQKYQITVPVVSCQYLQNTGWTPMVSYVQSEIFAIDQATATAVAQQYQIAALQAVENCQQKNLITKMYAAIGVDEYPASLPSSLITKDEGFIGNLIPNPNVQIANAAQFQKWTIERLDELFGQWEIPVEIKDSDPTTPGEQPVGVKLSNLAEAIAEIWTAVYQSYINSETLINIVMRILYESGSDKQQNFITYKLLQSLTDWVGFKQKDVQLEMSLLFTPNKEKLDEILKESKAKVPCVEFDEKFGLEADMMRYRKAASILDSLYFKKINPNGDIKEQVMNYLLEKAGSIAKVKNAGDVNEDFEKFLEDVQEGFKDVPGVTDPQNPYGRPYSQRPKIRDLTKPGEPD